VQDRDRCVVAATSGFALPRQPVVYALDVLLPIIDLRQQDFWIPDATRSCGQGS
jgi:hypothetical protein